MLMRVTPAIAERLLGTVYKAIKITGLVKFKIGDSVRRQILSEAVRTEAKTDAL